jgi:aerobic-type carbon monoxide dehydrogenase small subunit (CoxS/CutS family)
MLLTVNDRARSLTPAPNETLADTLRDRLHLTGTKVACGRGECGACTVLLNDEPVYACLTLTMACAGASVETIEGVAAPGRVHAVQEAFIAHDAVQCGFCTPGQVMAAIAMLRRNPEPDSAAIDRAMSGNLCRCGTYPKIVAAIHTAAQRMRQHDAR